MSSDVRDRIHPDTPGIRLNVDRYRMLFAALGCHEWGQIAAKSGLSPRTLFRARQGVIGEEFIVKTITALRDHAAELGQHGLEPPGLDDLFAVVAKPVAPRTKRGRAA